MPDNYSESIRIIRDWLRREQLATYSIYPDRLSQPEPLRSWRLSAQPQSTIGRDVQGMTTIDRAIEIAAELTTLTGSPWSAEPRGAGDSSAKIIGPDSMSIRIDDGDYAYHNGRYVFTGTVNRELINYVPNREQRQITVLKDKTAREAALSIKRRLLPVYRTMLLMVAQRQAEIAVREAARLATACAIRAQWPDAHRESRYEREFAGEFGRNGEPVHAEYNVYEGTVNISLQVPDSVAPIVIAALAGAVAS